MFHLIAVPLLYLLWFSDNNKREPEKTDLSRLVKFLSDDGTYTAFFSKEMKICVTVHQPCLPSAPDPKVYLASGPYNLGTLST